MCVSQVCVFIGRVRICSWPVKEMEANVLLRDIMYRPLAAIVRQYVMLGFFK